MPKIAYVAQHRRGLPELLKQLSETGYTVYRLDPTQHTYRSLRDDPPDMILADMTLRPSHITEILEALSKSVATNTIPLSVVGAAPQDVDDLRAKAAAVREIHAGAVTRKLLIDIVKKFLVHD